MKISFLAVLLCSGAAYAGVSGTTVVNYSIGNETGVTQTDLHVDANEPIDTATSSSFPSTLVTGTSAQFSGGNIAAGSEASFTLDATVTDENLAYVVDYCWSSVACSGNETYPLYFTFDGGGESDNQLEIATAATNSVAYEDLTVTQDGSSILTAPTSGTVAAEGDTTITDVLNFANGPIDFSVFDSTDNVTINGSFTATPEPSTIGLCALMLLGTVIAVRRRQLRNQ